MKRIDLYRKVLKDIGAFFIILAFALFVSSIDSLLDLLLY